MKKIILVLFVALFSFAAAEAQQPKGEKKSVTTTFVTDIDCAGCAKKVDNTIPYEKGVKDVKVDVAAKTVTVTYLDFLVGGVASAFASADDVDGVCTCASFVHVGFLFAEAEAHAFHYFVPRAGMVRHGVEEHPIHIEQHGLQVDA